MICSSGLQHAVENGGNSSWNSLKMCFLVICVTNLKLNETCNSCYCSLDYLHLWDCPRGTHSNHLEIVCVSIEASGCAGDWAPTPQWH